MVIADIKLEMQCFIYQVPLKKRENLYKTSVLRTHKSTQVYITFQDIEE